MNERSAGEGVWKSRVIAAVSLFVLINLALACIMPAGRSVLDRRTVEESDSETRQQGKWVWWVTRSFVEREKVPDVAIFGSSQIGSATFAADARLLKRNLDCVVHRRISTLEKDLEERLGYRLDSFSFGMGGAMVSDAYMAGRALLNGGKVPRLVVIGIAPRDFMDNTLPSPSATEPFKFFAPYVDLGNLSSSAFSDPFARLDWALDQTVPLKRLHRIVFDAVERYSHKSEGTRLADLPGTAGDAAGTGDGCGADTAGKDTPASSPTAGATGNRRMLQTISGTVSEVRRGEWVVPAFCPKVFEDNSSEYVRRYRTPFPPLYEREMAFFRAFLKDMHEKKVAVVVIGMPSLWPNRKLLPDSFWTKYRADVTAACAVENAEFVDMSARDELFTGNDYLDTVHLDADGGEKLFKAIADAVCERPRVVAALRAGAVRGATLGMKHGDGAAVLTRQTAAVAGTWR